MFEMHLGAYSCYLLIQPTQVALLDYGQVKDLPDKLRFGYANLILAIADNNPVKAAESYRYYSLPINCFFRH